MQPDLHHFLIRLASTVAVTLAPVLLFTLLSMPLSLHHHLGGPRLAENAPALHMT
jgi:hypothetical protein